MSTPGPGVSDMLEWLDRRFIRFMRQRGLLLLRLALGVVFVWFGLLKLVGQSPVADLVAATIYWLPAETSVPLLGAWEVLVGLGLLAGVLMRVTLFLMWLQLAGTFLVLLIRPDLSFQGGNPLLLTVLGEFVVKNIVLIAAGIAVGGTVRKPIRAELAPLMPSR